MKLSIVILNYNKKDLLLGNLESCLKLKNKDDEIIVVDNSSSDGSVQEVREKFPEIQLICSDTNLGVCGGRNLGFKAAVNEVVVYLDDDARLLANTLGKVREHFSSDNNIGVLTFSIVHMPDRKIENPLSGVEVAHYHGAGHAFSKKALEDIGYLDESMRFGAQEIESSMRLKMAGYKILFDETLKVEHWSFVPEGQDRTHRLTNSCRSWAYVYAKYFPLHYAVLFTFRRFVRFTRYCLKNNVSMFIVLKGLLKASSIFGKTVITKNRTVLSKDLVEYYLDPNVKPEFDTRPLF